MGKIDMTGWVMKEHGVPDSRLTVIKENKEITASHKCHNICWDCICECGNQITVRGTHLRTGAIKSCGCLSKEVNRKMMKEKIQNGTIKIFKHNLLNQRFGKLTVIKDLHQNHPTTHHALWLCKCDCGNTTVTSSACLLNGETSSCGCIKSKGEMKIQQCLEDAHIVFEKEKYYTDLVSITGTPLRYDFYINNNFLLEYDGIQHFQTTSGWGQSNSNLALRKQYDQQKTIYAMEHHIPLKRIPYWDLDQITIKNIMSDKWLVKDVA